MMKTAIALFAAAAATVLFSNTALAQINLAPFVPSESASGDGYGISTCISGDFANVRSGSENPESGGSKANETGTSGLINTNLERASTNFKIGNGGSFRLAARHNETAPVDWHSPISPKVVKPVLGPNCSTDPVYGDANDSVRKGGDVTTVSKFGGLQNTKVGKTITSGTPKFNSGGSLPSATLGASQPKGGSSQPSTKNRNVSQN